MNNGLLGWPVGPTKAQGLLGWPLGRLLAKQEMLTAGDQDGVTVTAAAGANAKGAWATLTEGLEINATGMLLGIGQATVARDYLIDIAVGPPGSEVVIVENLQLSMGSAANAGHPNVTLPFPVPARTRIAARIQATTGSSALGINAHLYSALQMPTCKAAKTYGANTADSGGVQVDPGASIGVKGAWTEITPNVERPISFLVVSIGNVNNIARSNANLAVDLGVGPPGLETEIITDLAAASSVTSDHWTPQWWSLPLAIASGSRVVARAASSISDATDRLVDVSFVGFG